MNEIYKIIKEDLSNNKFPENLTKNSFKTLFSYSQKNRLVSRMVSKIDKENLYKIIPDIPFKKYHFLFKTRYLELVKEIFDINKLLKKNNIEPIFLKGAYFYLIGIQNPEDRYMADIDILIKRDMIEKTIKILLDNGYSFKRFKNFESFYINHDWTHQTPVIITPNGYVIDIHHRVTSPRKIKGECALTKIIFEQLEYVDAYNSHFAIPKPEHCICHLAYNSAHHDMFSSGPSIFYDMRDLINFIKNIEKIDEVNKFIKTFQDHNKSINIVFAMCERMEIEIPFKYTKPPENIIDLSMQMILMGSEISGLNRKISLNNFSYRLSNSIQSKYLKSNYRIEGYFRLVQVLIYKLNDLIKYSIFIIFKHNLYKTHKTIRNYINTK